MRVRLNRNEPNAAQRKALRIECVKEFDRLLKNFNHDVMVQILYLFHFKYGYGEKRLTQLTDDLKEALEGIHARYELSDNDTPWLCETKLKEAGINIEEILGEE